MTHTPFIKHRKHGPDYRVRYRFIDQQDGGRRTLPSQGYRSDLHYEGDDLEIDGKFIVYMVHPEFLDAELNVIVDDTTSVPKEGYADMWILDEEMRNKVHRHKAVLEKICYFMEGPWKVAKAEIVLIHPSLNTL